MSHPSDSDMDALRQAEYEDALAREEPWALEAFATRQRAASMDERDIAIPEDPARLLANTQRLIDDLTAFDDAIGPYTAKSDARGTGFSLHVKFANKVDVMTVAVRFANLMAGGPGLLISALRQLEAHLIEAEAERVRVQAIREEGASLSTVHRCPPRGSGTMPCCDRTPFEVPHTDRMTLDDAQVTCGR